MLLVREVFSDWTATPRDDRDPARRPHRRGPAAATGRRWPSGRAAGKSLVAQAQDVPGVPRVVLPEAAGQHDDRAAADARRAGDAVLVGRALRTRRRPGLIITVPASDAPYQGFQLGRCGTSRSTSSTTRPRSPPTRRARSGRHAAFRRQRARPGRGQLARVHRAPPRLPADPLAAHVARVHAGGRPDGARSSRSTRCRAPAVLRRRHGDTGRVARPGSRAAGRRRGRMLGCSGTSGPAGGQGRRRLRRRPGSGPRDRDASARKAGADVVLASRTESRLAEVADEVKQLGRRALVGADRHQRRRRRAQPRRRDARRVRPRRRAGQQRVRRCRRSDRCRPSTSTQARAGFETNVLARAAADPAVRPRAAGVAAARSS